MGWRQKYSAPGEDISPEKLFTTFSRWNGICWGSNRKTKKCDLFYLRRKKTTIKDVWKSRPRRRTEGDIVGKKKIIEYRKWMFGFCRNTIKNPSGRLPIRLRFFSKTTGRASFSIYYLRKNSLHAWGKERAKSHVASFLPFTNIPSLSSGPPGRESNLAPIFRCEHFSSLAHSQRTLLKLCPLVLSSALASLEILRHRHDVLCILLKKTNWGTSEEKFYPVSLVVHEEVLSWTSAHNWILKSFP